MKELRGFVTGLALGAGLMYVLDPSAGRRRRALMRDRVVRGRHEISDAASNATTRVGNRMKGFVAETRSRFSSKDVDDVVLESRVRASLGRVVSNPGAISVLCSDGICTLSGPILSDELDRLLSAAAGVPGVREVRSQLTARETPGNISGLQGTEPEFQG